VTTVDKVNALEAERDGLRSAAIAEAKAIEKLMEDRVRHLEALRQIASMTETGIIAKGGHDVYRIACEALADAGTRPVNRETSLREERGRVGLERQS
jgi:S-adenosylhomocysteine hydrolase